MERFFDIKDPVKYDEMALQYLIRKYDIYFEKAIDKLHRNKFLYDSMQEAHIEAIDNQLEIIYRQCFPICAIYNGYFKKEKEDDLVEMIYLYSLCQTLILNNIDRHLDMKKQLNLLSDVNRNMNYIYASVLKGVIEACELTNGSSYLHNMLPTSLYIIQSMNQNYVDRYKVNLIYDYEKELDRYNNSIESRHLGSGFYESGIRSVFGYYNAETPAYLNDVLPKMRRLRQRIDEIEDVFEDLASGLPTYPVLLLLSSEKSGNIRDTILGMWNYVTDYKMEHDKVFIKEMIEYDEKLKQYKEEIYRMLIEKQIYVRLYEEAVELYDSIVDLVSESEDHNKVEDLLIILDLKRAFLERLKDNHWIDYKNIKSVVNIKKELRK